MSTMERLEDFRDLSRKLSRVMDCMGINKECVLRQRKTFLQAEHVETLAFPFFSVDARVYTFGSQTEVSTTPGLQSDIDKLFCYNAFNVIQDERDFKPNKINLLMDTTNTTPGYCKLRLFAYCKDSVIPHVVKINGVHFLKTTLFYDTPEDGTEVHGPALNFLSRPGVDEHDNVGGFQCSTWPNHFRKWSSHNMTGHWPAAYMIDYINQSGCFLVPTRRDNQNLEWRISTSLAERCLMFHLNITQLRCYILLKMIRKTFINGQGLDDTITSYHCKTALLHCIEQYNSQLWTEQNLVRCVTKCLSYLLNCLENNRCPNYFYEHADLFLEKFDNSTRERLIEIIRDIIQSPETYLQRIEIDELNKRLASDVALVRKEIISYVYGHTMLEYCVAVLIQVRKCIWAKKNEDEMVLCDHVRNKALDYSRQGPLEYVASSGFWSGICSHLAPITVSRRLSRGQDVDVNTLRLFKISFKSDAVASRLKYASFLFCTGQVQRASTILKETQEKLQSGNITNVCCCYPEINERYIPKEMKRLEQRILNPTTNNAAFCVMFTDQELACCPQELYYEMFRTITDEDKLLRDDVYHVWMDSIIIDPEVYMCFLQYMVSINHCKEWERSFAIFKLALCVGGARILPHRATGYNLLGKCCERENEPVYAFKSYCMSMKDTPRNNSARWHIAILLYSLWRKANPERGLDVLGQGATSSREPQPHWPGRPTSCPVPTCHDGHTYKTFYSFNQHWKRKHEDTIDLFQCPSCQKLSNWKTTITKHLRTQHASCADMKPVCMKVPNRAFVNPVDVPPYQPSFRLRVGRKRKRLVILDIFFKRCKRQ